VLNDAIQRYDNLEEYHNIRSDKENQNSGNNGVLQVLNNTINSIAHKQCFNKDQFDIVDNLINGKIVIIDVSGFNTQMLNFLNLSIYNRLIKQTSISYDKSPITIFIDEAQKIINENSVPDTDVCRENKFEFIFATQDKLLLEKQIGVMNMESLNRNITSQFSFKTTVFQKTKVDTTTLDKFEYTNIISGEKFLADPIFFENDELFDAEYLYQKSISAFDYVDLNSKRKYILKYLPELEDEYKCLVYFKTNKSSKVVDVYFDTDKLMDSIKEYNQSVAKDNNSGSNQILF
jgi:hypothetical protein